MLGSNFALLVKSPGDDGQQLLTTGSSYVYRCANTTAAVVNSVKQLFYQCGSVRENDLTTVIYDSIMFVLRSTEGRLILGSVFFLPFILGSIT